MKEDMFSMNILVIDDDDRVRDLLRDILLLGGHRVIEAPDGGAGIQYLEKGSSVDMVMTDLVMPVKNGWEVAKWVKLKSPELPVVLITGWGERLDEEKVRETRIDLIISKPFEIYEILKLVDQLGKDLKKK
jgi:CheY-like chemotaxis protein